MYFLPSSLMLTLFVSLLLIDIDGRIGGLEGLPILMNGPAEDEVFRSDQENEVRASALHTLTVYLSLFLPFIPG